MTYVSIGLCILAIAAITVTAVRIVKEPRRAGHGLFLMGSIVLTWIAALFTSVAFASDRDLSLLIAYGPIVGGIMVVLASSVVLLINGVVVVRKEGMRISTLVPTVFGLALLAAVGFSFFGLFAIRSMTSFILYGLVIIFISLPLGMIVTQLAGFTLYALLYSRLGDPRAADYIVVHGAGLSGENLTPLLRSRVDKGIEVYRAVRAEGMTPTLILSGGQGPDEVISEAEAMARYALKHGVDEEHILREDRSTTTEENVRYALEMVKEQRGADRGLASCRMVFVTSDYHVLRTAALTRRLGAPGSVVGARTALYYVPAGFLREFVATLKQFARANVITWACLSALLAAAVTTMVIIGAQQKYPLDENGNEIRSMQAPAVPGE